MKSRETADSLLVQQLYIAKLSKRTAGLLNTPRLRSLKSKKARFV